MQPSETIKYSRHYLTQVIFLVNFNIDALKDTIDHSLAELCRQKTGANLSELKNTNISFLPNQVSSTVHSKWVFRGDIFQIVVQSDFLQIINFRYTNYSDFHPLIEEVFNKVKEIYKPIFTRIALRYINDINFSEGSTFDFNNLINPVLLQPTLDYKDFGLTRSIGVMNIFDQDENIQTNFIYGFVNSEFPNRIAKREFLLDFDCYIMLNVAIDTAKPIILQLRNKVNELFEKSILDGLREKMK